MCYDTMQNAGMWDMPDLFFVGVNLYGVSTFFCMHMFPWVYLCNYA